MKNRNTIIMAVLLAAVISCKDKSTETLPREAYSQNPEGVIVKTAPDSKSTMVTTIPFAEKVTLSEKSDKINSQTADKTVWYKVQWNGKTGWIQGSSVGGSESVSDQIKMSFTEQKSNLNSDFVRAFESSQVKIIEKYSYPGGEMEPAKIFFLEGGAMVVNSRIFTENYSNTFFSYEFLSEGKLLKIKFVDSKLNFDMYADSENNSQSVFKIDKTEHSIIYQVKNKSFYLFNWGFMKE